MTHKLMNGKLVILLLFQCIEYFQEWSLNPSNYSFDEIRKGTKQIQLFTL